MSQAAKRLEAMLRNPTGDWQIDDVAAVCRAFGIDCNAPTRGSHHRVAHPAMTAILTIPARRPIQPMYIGAMVTYIDELGATENE